MTLTETTNSANQKIAKTAGYYMAFIALGIVTSVLGPTLTDLAEHTQSTVSQISYLFSARSFGYLITALLGGRLYDRVPGHILMVSMLLVMVATMALVPMMPLLWILIIVLVVMGIAEGMVDVGGNTMLVWVHRDKVEPFMNGLHFFFGAGAFIAPIIIAQAVAISGDIYWAYWSLALLILPIALWIVRLPSPTPLVISEEGPAGQVNYLLVGLIVFFFFLYVGAEVAFGGWVFTYATTLNLTTPTIARYLTSAFWGMLTIGRLAAIPISVRVRPRYMLLTGLLGSLVSVGIILFWRDSMLAVWLGTLGLGLSMASVFPTTLNLAERRMTITGRVMGWFFVGASVGAMFLPWFVGQWIESIGPVIVMAIIFVDLLLALGLFFVLISYSARSAGRGEV